MATAKKSAAKKGAAKKGAAKKGAAKKTSSKTPAKKSTAKSNVIRKDLQRGTLVNEAIGEDLQEVANDQGNASSSEPQMYGGNQARAVEGQE